MDADKKDYIRADSSEKLSAGICVHQRAKSLVLADEDA
jgi:hypothetical protein